MKKIILVFLSLICLLFTYSVALAADCINPITKQVVKTCPPTTPNCFYDAPKNPTDPGSYSCESEDSPRSVLGQISPPPQVVNLGFGSIGVSNLVNRLINFIYIGATIVFVFFVLFSAFELIMSGGDKEKVENARKRLTYAIIGIAVLAVSFLIITIVGQLTGFKFYAGQRGAEVFPSPTPKPTPAPLCAKTETNRRCYSCHTALVDIQNSCDGRTDVTLEQDSNCNYLCKSP